MSEETKTEEKDKGEDKKDEKRNQTPPAGGQDFSRPQGQANLIMVRYLDQEDVHHTSTLSSYELCNKADTEKGRLRRLACNIERKEKGGGKAEIGAVCDPGAMASPAQPEASGGVELPTEGGEGDSHLHGQRGVLGCERAI